MKMVTFMSVVALVAQCGWPLIQMNIYNAFLQSVLLEKVYMSLPQGFGSQGRQECVDYSNPFMA